MKLTKMFPYAEVIEQEATKARLLLPDGSELIVQRKITRTWDKVSGTFHVKKTSWTLPRSRKIQRTLSDISF